METIKFNPNLENIEKRSQITPFGKAAKHNEDGVLPKVSITEFTKYTTTVHVDTVQPVEEFYQASHNASINFDTDIDNSEKTVRVSNIPIRIHYRELHELLTGGDILAVKNIRLIYDKETRISKGVAYVTCEDEQKAKDFCKRVREIVIDSLKLCVEIL